MELDNVFPGILNINKETDFRPALQGCCSRLALCVLCPVLWERFCQASWWEQALRLVQGDTDTSILILCAHSPQSCLPLQPARLLCPWDSPGKNTGVERHFLLQGTFPTQRWITRFLHWQADSLPLSHLGSASFPDQDQPGAPALGAPSQPLGDQGSPIHRK